MTIETMRGFFLWCSVINFALLAMWGVLAIFLPDRLYGLVRRKFPVTREHFDLMNYGGITLYKIGIFLFNIVPLISLYIIK